MGDLQSVEVSHVADEPARIAGEPVAVRGPGKEPIAVHGRSPIVGRAEVPNRRAAVRKDTGFWPAKRKPVSLRTAARQFKNSGRQIKLGAPDSGAHTSQIRNPWANDA